MIDLSYWQLLAWIIGIALFGVSVGQCAKDQQIDQVCDRLCGDRDGVFDYNKGCVCMETVYSRPGEANE